MAVKRSSAASDLLDRAAGPCDFHAVHLGSLTQADCDGQFRLRQIAARGHDLPRQGAASHAL